MKNKIREDFMKHLFFVFSMIVFVFCIVSSVSAEENWNRIVNDEADAKALYQKAVEFTKQMKMNVDRDIYMRFEELEHIKVHASSSGGRSGENVLAFYRPYGPELIFMPKGVTAIDFYTAAVHELTHAWNSSNCPPQDRSVNEGLSKWMEFMACMSVGDRAKSARILGESSVRDPIEYKVVQHLMKLYKEGGIEAVKKYVKETYKYEDK